MAEYTELIKALRHCYEDDDACATCQRWLAHDEWGIKCKGRLISDAAAAIEELLPKRGQWELIDGAEPMRWGCSRCKYLSWETSNYCPRCGAKMEVRE